MTKTSTHRLSQLGRLGSSPTKKPPADAPTVLPTTLNAPTTKTLLIDAAEKLIAAYGFHGVTLRDIAETAGQANASVVQYHFKDKTGLIEAIFEDRRQRRETMRAERLTALKAEGKQHDTRSLLEMLWLPSLTFREADGKYVFCHFALQCLLRADLLHRYPSYLVFETRHSGSQAKDDGSVLPEVVRLLQVNCPNIPPSALPHRLSALSLMFIASVVEFDNARGAARKSHFDIEPLLDMAVISLSAGKPKP